MNISRVDRGAALFALCWYGAVAGVRLLSHEKLLWMVVGMFTGVVTWGLLRYLVYRTFGLALFAANRTSPWRELGIATTVALDFSSLQLFHLVGSCLLTGVAVVPLLTSFVRLAWWAILLFGAALLVGLLLILALVHRRRQGALSGGSTVQSARGPSGNAPGP